MIRVVTSFNPKQYEVYGRRFIESYQRFCDKPLHIVYEGDFDPPEGVTASDLWADPEFRTFAHTWQDKPFAHGVLNDGKVTYRLQAMKFAKKVFAYTSLPDLSENDWWVWIDADVEFFAPATDEWWSRVCPGGFRGSYIGRRRWSHPECGFMGFSMRYHGADALKEIRRFYTSGLLFGLPEWHDSYVFGVVQRAQDIRGTSRWFDLAEGVEETGEVPHPWPDTALGEVCAHRKGPMAKREIYGEVA